MKNTANNTMTGEAKAMRREHREDYHDGIPCPGCPDCYPVEEPEVDTKHKPLVLPGYQCPDCGGPVVEAPYSNVKCAAKCQGRRTCTRAAAHFAFLEARNAELLDVARNVIGFADGVVTLGVLFDQARAAIAKATGQGGA